MVPSSSSSTEVAGCRHRGESQVSIDLVLRKDTKQPLTVEASSLARHSAILAQSGSGKSFLLGRLLEELLLKTKARVIVLDPNSDFVRIAETSPGTWTGALTPWLFPGEAIATFQPMWHAIPKLVLSNRNLDGLTPPKVNWGALTDGERASVMNIDARHESDLYWCLVLSTQLASETWESRREADFDFDHFRDQAEAVCEFLLTGRGPAAVKQSPLAQTLRRSLGATTSLRFRALVANLGSYELWRARGDAVADLRDLLSETESPPRLVVVDLLSLPSEEERVAVASRVLESVWDSARTAYGDALREPGQPDLRVPTFLVIDEAHNLVPAKRESTAAERFASHVIRVAAEGRKFGLHLIVVSQRPRKVDANILTECDNLLLMRMTSAKDIEYAKESFGFLTDSLANQATSLTLGDVLLAGGIGVGDFPCHVAPRRTREGGRSLADAYWSTAP